MTSNLLRSISPRATILLLVLGVSLISTAAPSSALRISNNSAQSSIAGPGQSVPQLSNLPRPALNSISPSNTTGTTTTSYYYNWSGYAATDTGKPYVSVQSTYVQPIVTCPTAVSPNGTVLPNNSPAYIKDNLGNIWTVSGGVVKKGSAAAGYSSGVTEITYVNNVVWQENGANLWWPWNGAKWSGTGTSTSPLTGVNAVSPPVDWTLFWVGFDGYQNGTVEQAGTAAQCGTAANATPHYYAWWEMYPTNSIQVMPITIKPGDKIQATTTYIASTGNYDLSVTDLTTTSQHYTKVTKCAANLTCARQSADWIVERPTYNGVYTNLADWKTMSLTADLAANTTTTNAHTKVVTPNMKPVSAFPNAAIDMVNDPYTGEILANVGALSSTGQVFTDTWDAVQ